MSKDTVESHKKFKAKYAINFPLLADPGLEAVKAYGAWQEKNMYGKKVMGIARSTFLIDEEGRVASVWPKVKVDGHARAVLDALR